VYFSIKCKLSDQTHSYRPSTQYYIMDQPSEHEVRSSQLTLYEVYTHIKIASSSCIRQLWTASAVFDTSVQLTDLLLGFRTSDTTRLLHFKNVTSQEVRISLNIHIMPRTALANTAKASPLPTILSFTLLSNFTLLFIPITLLFYIHHT